MGDVDINKVKNIDPLKVREFTGVEPIRIGQIAPAALHIKELNHIDPISVDSLRIDQVRNVDPVRIERFDVTYLPTVNITMSRMPSMDVVIGRMPPLAVGVDQDFCVPSRYTIHARLLGIEVMRFELHGQSVIAPRHRVHRERSRTHERSFPDVAAVGNPGIPTRRMETAEAMAHHAHSRGSTREGDGSLGGEARARDGGVRALLSRVATMAAENAAWGIRSARATMGGPSGGLSAGVPRASFSVPAPGGSGSPAGSVSSGDAT